jgi:hypothetical protein
MDDQDARSSAVAEVRAWLLPIALAMAAGCTPKAMPAEPSRPPERDASAFEQSDARAADAASPSMSGSASPPFDTTGAEPRVLRFAWRPPGGSEAAYEMTDPRDQHRILFTPGVTPGHDYPVVIAFHGQPKRGQSPSTYAFPAAVGDVAIELVRRGEVEPLVVALPVFRFLGANWPAFDLVAFRRALEERLRANGIRASAYYVVGHSGAAGCGGDGMNRAHRIRPKAVGFFDTCLGGGWRDEVALLRSARIPTVMIHSVETAGFVPRQPQEYSSGFDFGVAYAAVGLAAARCPTRQPEVPLRPRPFRCTADAEGIVKGLVIDTGEGEAAHNAVVPVAFAYFLREYLGRHENGEVR